jgi:adenylosuccinate synthase
MLDIDFGTYPYVTSSNTISSGACIGLGVAPTKIREVIGIAKAYCTRVGSGPFPTELDNDMGERLRQIGGEFGATTGRPRRTGWIDLVALKYATMLNGVTQIVITKADILNEFETIDFCTSYKVNGEQTTSIPFDIDRVNIEPVYETVPGWNQDLSPYKDFASLPATVTNYLGLIEKHLGAPVSMLSTGPQREKLIVK